MTKVGRPTTVSRGFSSTVEPMGAFSCDNCGRYSIASGGTTNESDVRSIDLDLWFESVDPHLKWIPTQVVGKQFDDVPEHIADAASEAFECFSVGAYRATVQMSRSVVEATAKSKGFSSGRLINKIDAMYESQLLRPHIKDAAHEIRHLGNEMAHGDFIEPVTKEEAEEVLGLMSEILAEVFQSPPARVERRRAAREARTARSSDT